MSTFKRRRYACAACDTTVDAFAWDYDAPPQHCGQAMHEDGARTALAPGVVDDSFTPHWCETLGHEPVWVESKSQLRREAEARGLVNVVRHEEAYYAKQRKMHDEYLRDTGQLVTQPRVR